MSTGPENRFIAAIHRQLPKELYREKMHNPYRGGTFDVWYSGNKADLWIEYKWGNNSLSALQLKWGEGRHKEGRKVAVARGFASGKCTWYTRPEEWVNAENGFVGTKDTLVEWIINQTMGSKVENKSKTARNSKGT
jgi:hypothetical protein